MGDLPIYLLFSSKTRDFPIIYIPIHNKTHNFIIYIWQFNLNSFKNS